MTEYDETVQLANRVLERPNADPDDDLAMLARQFLRSIERLSFAGESAVRMARLIESERKIFADAERQYRQRIEALTNPVCPKCKNKCPKCG